MLELISVSLYTIIATTDDISAAYPTNNVNPLPPLKLNKPLIPSVKRNKYIAI